MNNDIMDVLDTNAASVFGGDTFYDVETLDHFQYLLERWTKETNKLKEDLIND